MHLINTWDGKMIAKIKVSLEVLFMESIIVLLELEKQFAEISLVQGPSSKELVNNLENSDNLEKTH